MTGKTHIVGGIAAALITSQLADTNEIAVMIPGAVIGSLIPDICHSGSTVGRRIPLLSLLVGTIFGHRTFTHSLLFLFVLSGAAFFFIPSMNFNVGLVVGVISHLLLDAATKRGIKLFYPLKFTFRLPVTTKTGGLVELIIFFVLGGYVVLQLIFWNGFI